METHETLRSTLSFYQKTNHVPTLFVTDTSGFSYGEADERTPWNVASQTKMFTAIVILRLAHEGKLRLEDPLGAHLDLDGDAGRRSILSVLSHTAGLSRDGSTGHWSHEPFPDETTLLDDANKTPLVFPDREQAKYSNLGFALLGQVIAHIDGDYHDSVRTRILEPLELNDTSFDGDAMPGFSVRNLDGERRELEPRSAKAYDAATGLISSARDMIRFIRGAKDLLPEHLLSLAWSGQWNETDGQNYGLGFRLRTTDGLSTVGHSGGYFGTMTKLEYDPKQDRAIFVAANAIDVSAPLICSFAFGFDHQSVELPTAPGVFTNVWGSAVYGTTGTDVVLLDPTDLSLERASRIEDDHLTSGAVWARRGEPVAYSQDSITLGGHRLERDDRFYS